MNKAVVVGNEDFEKIVSGNAYYIDKTLLIKDLIDTTSGANVNLFVRPRRFGKTLTLSTIKCFFEDTLDSEKNISRKNLFTNLSIYKSGELYTSQMASYPVINLTFKDHEQLTWKDAVSQFRLTIRKIYKEHDNLFDKLDDEDKQMFLKYKTKKASLFEMQSAFSFLAEKMHDVIGKPAIILLDEYDVPLQSAYSNGYFSKMMPFLKNVFLSSFKTNDHLYFAAIVGCLRLSNESLFTGMNNLCVYSVLSPMFREAFGFTEDDVKELLKYYNIEDKFSLVKEWYNGYLMAGKEIYNPWSICSYIRDNRITKVAPKSYWANTGSNKIIKNLIKSHGSDVRYKFQDLLDGKAIKAKVTENLTYDKMFSSEDMWSFLLFTGYLKSEEFENDVCYLSIPNREVLDDLRMMCKELLEDDILPKYKPDLLKALKNDDCQSIQDLISGICEETISYWDPSAEGYYHGFLTGIFTGMGLRTLSNREKGLGRPDIIVFLGQKQILFELKSEKDVTVETQIKHALDQIKENRYIEGAMAEGATTVVAYGCAFRQKTCAIKKYEI
ncbi:MAG: ATP-binding protein [Clostridiales bacterium]|nr:ATP-binding protein [Clostridiales bacterium]